MWGIFKVVPTCHGTLLDTWNTSGSILGLVPLWGVLNQEITDMLTGKKQGLALFFPGGVRNAGVFPFFLPIQASNKETI